MPGRNIFTVLEETAKNHGKKEALHQPLGTKGGGGYRAYSWDEWLTASREIAVGLHALGMVKSETGCILCETRAEFYLVDLGVMGAGGVAAALYTAYPVPDLARDIGKSAPRFLFVEDAATLLAISGSLTEQGAALPEHVILISGEQTGAHSLEDLRQLGRTTLLRDPGAFARIQE